MVHPIHKHQGTSMVALNPNRCELWKVELICRLSAVNGVGTLRGTLYVTINSALGVDWNFTVN